MSKPWWFPTLCDAEYCQRLRDDYPDKADWDDEALIYHFNEGLKYQNLWDHVGDAYAQFEPLADSYLELLAALEAHERLHVNGILKTSNEEVERVHAMRRAALSAAKGDDNG